MTALRIAADRRPSAGSHAAAICAIPPAHALAASRCTQSLPTAATRGEAEFACPPIATASRASATDAAASRQRHEAMRAAAASATTAATRPAPDGVESR
jgi:hypothetical protein